MSKQVEKLKKQLGELYEVINSFNSESVQLRVTDRGLNHLIQFNKQDNSEDTQAQLETAVETGTSPVQKEPENLAPTPALTTRKPGPTKILNQLLTTRFFSIPRSLPEITDYMNTNFDSGNFYTYQLSGILLEFFKKKKLARITQGNSGSYFYQLPSN